VHSVSHNAGSLWTRFISFLDVKSSFFIAFLSRVSVLTRDIDIAILSVRPFVRLSVRPSVTSRYLIKTA